jgi:hypothetical protein
MNDLIAVKKLAKWDRLKELVLDSVASPITRGVYNIALTNSWTGTCKPRALASARQR